MAGKNAGAGCGCLGLLVLAAMCTAALSDGGSSGSNYSSSTYPTSTTWTESSYTATAAQREPQEWFYIHGTMNVRAEPNRNARIVRTLSRGDRVQLGPADANGWASLYDGATAGYVYRASDNVRTGPPAAQLYGSSSGGSASGGGRRRSSGSRTYHTGPRGGCYYYSSSGRKQYVDRSNCH